ncbi:DUF4258 domain-containing protein [Marinomonas agarivorans]|nr:DUF4258 domain-containing protein [Marinomonas agarivorans]
MKVNKPQGITVFPLSEYTARKIMKDLATNHTEKIRWSQHIKRRMNERGITTKQILILLKSQHSVFREGPYPDFYGNWQFNIKGMAAGEIIELTVVLKNHHDSPNAALITVWVH